MKEKKWPVWREGKEQSTDKSRGGTGRGGHPHCSTAFDSWSRWPCKHPLPRNVLLQGVKVANGSSCGSSRSGHLKLSHMSPYPTVSPWAGPRQRPGPKEPYKPTPAGHGIPAWRTGLRFLRCSQSSAQPKAPLCPALPPLFSLHRHQTCTMVHRLILPLSSSLILGHSLQLNSHAANLPWASVCGGH